MLADIFVLHEWKNISHFSSYLALKRWINDVDTSPPFTAWKRKTRNFIVTVLWNQKRKDSPSSKRGKNMLHALSPGKHATGKKRGKTSIFQITFGFDSLLIGWNNVKFALISWNSLCKFYEPISDEQRENELPVSHSCPCSCLSNLKQSRDRDNLCRVSCLSKECEKFESSDKNKRTKGWRGDG